MWFGERVKPFDTSISIRLGGMLLVSLLIMEEIKLGLGGTGGASSLNNDEDAKNQTFYTHRAS